MVLDEQVLGLASTADLERETAADQVCQRVCGVPTVQPELVQGAVGYCRLSDVTDQAWFGSSRPGVRRPAPGRPKQLGDAQQVPLGRSGRLKSRRLGGEPGGACRSLRTG